MPIETLTHKELIVTTVTARRGYVVCEERQDSTGKVDEHKGAEGRSDVWTADEAPLAIKLILSYVEHRFNHCSLCLNIKTI